MQYTLSSKLDMHPTHSKHIIVKEALLQQAENQSVERQFTFYKRQYDKGKNSL